VRDRAFTKLRKKLYGIAAFGWTGSTKHWQRHESLSLVLAGLSTPLVLSVHTIVSFDFATSVIPGWHTTIFPPYFVAGAIFSGFAMVQSLLVIVRKVFGLEDYITMRDGMAVITLPSMMKLVRENPLLDFLYVYDLAAGAYNFFADMKGLNFIDALGNNVRLIDTDNYDFYLDGLSIQVAPVDKKIMYEGDYEEGEE
jgi:Ni/Fe-hydrogenase subunit HybB-like protein